MKKGLLALIALFSVGLHAAPQESRSVKFTGCEGLDAKGISASVKRDYLRTVLRAGRTIRRNSARPIRLPGLTRKPSKAAMMNGPSP